MKRQNSINHSKNRLIGANNRSAGAAFEKLIEQSLEYYKQSGQSVIEKTPEPMRPISKPNAKGQFLAVYTHAAQPDYKGTLKGGQSVVFEAKHTDTDRLLFDRVTKEQRESMEMYYSAGSAAYIVISYGMRAFYVVPWEIFRDMQDIFGRKYVKETDIAGFQVGFSGFVRLLDGMKEVKG